jgi:hypothetical protein
MSDRSQDLAHLHGLVPLKRRSIQQREASQPRFQLAFYVAGTIREHRESSVFNRLADTRKEVILEGREDGEVKLLILNGGQRRDRTADAGLFRAALYH